jgi:hypothetical protein
MEHCAHGAVADEDAAREEALELGAVEGVRRPLDNPGFA